MTSRENDLFQERDNYNCVHLRLGYVEHSNCGFNGLNSFLVALRVREELNEKTLGATFKNNKNTITCYFCFPGLKNQGDVDETGTQLSLTMVIVLCVVSLVAVAMICGTIVVVVLYKRWSAKHEARTTESIIPPETRDKKPSKVLKLWVPGKVVPAYYTLGHFFGSVCDAWQNCSHIYSCLLGRVVQSPIKLTQG